MKTNKQTNAQELINEVEKEDLKKIQSKEDFKKMFYKTIWEQETADLNLSGCVGK